ncbi:FAD:protein FMN transferase [Stappia sp. BW2]|uniref:FAD:protein FMN transferase n=1 Tax=Stappia sp. BW2 TaxID=2592622 RepID=UPI001AD8E0AE|nr:FAD:protein FMN transferase [Stappia sp. BW2]
MTHATINQPPMNRRRFLRICAASVAGLALPAAGAMAGGQAQLYRWRGIALGAGAEIDILHESASEAKRLFTKVEAEIRRLEAIFSLYQPDSELVRLNANGRLSAPSLEMVDLLGLCHRLHAATEGAFDPTIQPLWAYYARQASGDAGEVLAAARSRTGFKHVVYGPGEIRFAQRGMSMSFNGIAQGYITDRVTAFLASKGCTNMVVDLGEIVTRGRPDEEPALDAGSQRGWPVTLQPVAERAEATTRIRLTDAAVASSARLGTTFDQAGRRSHIIDPRTGLPVAGAVDGASVIAPAAALADGLSTAALVLEENRLGIALAELPATSAFVVRRDGSAGWLTA